MITIIGLGNPGKKYKNTRHNIGFMLLDSIANEEKTTFVTRRYFKAKIAHINIKGQDILLVKPQTFMNFCGKSAQEVVGYFRIPIDKIWLVYDDIDLELGKIRTRSKGSTGGHKGVESVLKCLKSQNINRYRIGINNPKTKGIITTENYVLSKFTSDEMKVVEKIIAKTKEMIKEHLQNGFKETSN